MTHFLVILIAIFVYCECISSQDDLIFNKEDDGKIANLKVADEFFISLDASPTTGYTWAVAQIDSSLIEQIGEVAFKAESELLGASGIQTFTFNCIQTGNTVLEMIYHRPWDKESAPLDTFSLTLNITD